jgi:hypothetical protein
MKYAIVMWLGAMIHIPSFIKIGSGIQKLTRGDSQTDHDEIISLDLFFPNKVIWLIIFYELLI